jgi:hypothetical protein
MIRSTVFRVTSQEREVDHEFWNGGARALVNLLSLQSSEMWENIILLRLGSISQSNITNWKIYPGEITEPQ